MSFGSKIIKYREDILRDMATLVAIPSVRGPAEKGMPFGKAPAEALGCILSIAERMGLDVKNIGNYAGHAEYGKGEEYAAVLTHVDVVPAGDGWETEPFTMVIRDGLAIGRGTADDKGAAVAALYCLKVLQEENVPAKRRMRVVFGAGEETASNDMEVYFSSESMPVMGFTPDGDYGICNREKGLLRVKFTAPKNDSAAVLEFSAGTVVNAVPAKAEARLACTVLQTEKLENAAKTAEGDFTIIPIQGGAAVVSVGRACHAMQPQDGFNAAAHLISLLGRVFDETELGTMLSFVKKRIGTELDGASLLIKQNDEQSGPLTLNLGLVNIDASQASFCIDIRYPVTSDGEKIIAILKQNAEDNAFPVQVTGHTPPLYLSQESPFLVLLQDAYRSVTGQEAALYSTGGGSYARSMNSHGVAFGPFFPDEPDRRLHNTGEHIEIERFMEHAQICLEAMYRMITA